MANGKAYYVGEDKSIITFDPAVEEISSVEIDFSLAGFSGAAAVENELYYVPGTADVVGVYDTTKKEVIFTSFAVKKLSIFCLPL